MNMRTGFLAGGGVSDIYDIPRGIYPFRMSGMSKRSK